MTNATGNDAQVPARPGRYSPVDQVRPLQTDWSLIDTRAYVCRNCPLNSGGIDNMYEKNRPEQDGGLMSVQDYREMISREMDVCLPVAQAYKRLTMQPAFKQGLGDKDTFYVNFQASHRSGDGCYNMSVQFLDKDMKPVGGAISAAPAPPAVRFEH